jgi:hypothetical protein
MTFSNNDIIPPNKFFKGLIIGFIVSSFMWASFIFALIITEPDYPSDPASIALDAPAPNAR